MVELRIALALGLVALVFAMGFGASHLQSEAKIKSIEATHARAQSDAMSVTLAMQKQLDAKADAERQTVARIDTQQTALLRKDQDELEKLRNCVARGTCGVRVIGAKCPAPGNVPGAPNSAGVGAGASPELDADARQVVLDLRAGLIFKERQLAACQSILEARQQQ